MGRRKIIINDSERKSVGAKLYEFRNVLQLTLEELALELGTTKAHLSNVERGIKSFPMEFMIELAKRYGLNPLYMLGLEVKMFNHFLKRKIKSNSEDIKT